MSPRRGSHDTGVGTTLGKERSPPPTRRLPQVLGNFVATAARRARALSQRPRSSAASARLLLALVVQPSSRDPALCGLPLSEGGGARGLAFWRRPGKWQGLDGSPRFPLPERLCAVRDGPGVPAVAPLPGTFPGACYGSRRASWDSKTICLQALGRPGAVPVRRPGRGSGYGPVPAGRWALTPRATRNSAATSRVAASAPSGNT